MNDYILAINDLNVSTFRYKIIKTKSYQIQSISNSLVIIALRINVKLKRFSEIRYGD
jgi:hypothetical protein